jgi:uncharacterized protein with ParB-like and HNH nuclease domain
MSLTKKDNKKTIHGGRNLVLMALLAISIALTTSSISLAIYRATGDIYLDRSRPGFISENEKHNTEDDGKEKFKAEGGVAKKDIEEYLNTLNTIDKRIRDASESFSEDPISDETLGITASEPDQTEVVAE